MSDILNQILATKHEEVTAAKAELPLLLLRNEAEDAALEGLEVDGKVVMIYSPHGLNDTAHTEGCCCCGGNEVQNARQVNVNLLAYTLTH